MLSLGTRLFSASCMTGGEPPPSADDIIALFANSEAGDWWDASDLSTMWTDSAGTTQVSAANDTVGKWVGKVNSNALTQGTSAKRPVVGTTLDHNITDGVDDNLQATFSVSQPYTRISAFKPISWPQSVNNGVLDGKALVEGALFNSGSTPTMSMFNSANLAANNDPVVGTAAIVTEIWNGASSKLAVNANAYATGNPGAGAATGLTVGSFGGTGANSFSNVAYYQILEINRVLTDDEITTVRQFFANKAGVTL